MADEITTLNEFSDMLGRVWRIDSSPDAIDRIWAELDLDLEQVALGEMREFRKDYIRIRDVLGVLLADQLAERGLTIDDVAGEMDEACTLAAAVAIARSLAETYPAVSRSELRNNLRVYVSALEKLETAEFIFRINKPSKDTDQ